MFVFPKRSPRKGLDRTNLDALRAATALFFHGLASHPQWRVGEYRCPSHPRPYLRCNQQAAFADPPQPGQMRRQFM
jgi:hypothetical protein